MEDNLLIGTTTTFIAPSGFEYSIREQNGADDDVLSNAADAKTLKNIDNFISGIVIKTDSTKSGKLTPNDVHNMPSLDKYCILLQSRILSFGPELEFTHDWGENGGIVNYEQDLNDYLLDYSNITPEELLEKPEAIPAYPLGKDNKDIPITLSTGKRLKFDLLNGESEIYILGLTVGQNTKNKELIARNLRLEVDGNYEKVQSFSLFTSKEMIEIRKEIKSVDPVFNGRVSLDNPHYPGMRDVVNLIAIEGFFYPGEI